MMDDSQSHKNTFKTSQTMSLKNLIIMAWDEAEGILPIKTLHL